ncbi:oligopeptidase A . Metallo peptidase. MEROPS family M03A [Alteromonadaceae bacterium Bs31]|nr:oligopeptidase A . Metallo peptidase. MEROPS family M03A [Alteromonadaceae bacterium Bs31]
MNNPLLQSHILPPFDAIQTEHVLPAVESLLAEAREQLDKQLEGLGQVSWEKLAAPIEARGDKLNQAWAPVGHLNAVCNSEALREAYEKGRQLLTDYYTELGQNEQLFAAYKALGESAEFSSLNQAQKKTVENALRDFHLSGVDLPADKKKRYGEIQSRLSSLTNQFSNNVLDATQGWYKHIESEQQLVGLPEFAVAGAKQAAEAKKLSGWVLTLDTPVFFTVITQSENAALRKEMYQAFNTRASDQGPSEGKWDNSEVMEEIMQLRQELAGLLGFKNYSEYSIAPKMAETTPQVVDFLRDLAAKSKPHAEKDLQELKDFARSEHGIEELNAWDIPFYSEKLKLARYNISQEELRPYFPAETVIAGLFKVANQLFNIEFVDKTSEVQTWHESVKYYQIQKCGEAIAGFYFDLFAREGKRGGAWMDECRVRRSTETGLQLPVAYLVCNFNSPLGNKPSLLTHNEVTTTFHEFGHGIHHMLTKIDVAAVSGINGVAWDAVELPSQFMENFCWEREVLQFLSCHFETGEPLPEEMLNNMLAAKNFQAAMFMQRQLEFSLFDFLLHMQYGQAEFPGIQKLLDRVRDEVAVFTPPEFNRFQHSFSHIFAGGYAAGYYSYKWAEVLSADAYSAFEEAGIFDKATGQRYLSEILEKGGSQDAMELFKNFRGREPKVDALLRHSGIAA